VPGGPWIFSRAYCRDSTACRWEGLLPGHRSIPEVPASNPKKNTQQLQCNTKYKNRTQKYYKKIQQKSKFKKEHNTPQYNATQLKKNSIP